MNNSIEKNHFNKEYSFHLSIQDTFHRLFIEYNGIDKISIILWYKDGVNTKEIPFEDINYVIELTRPLRERIQEYGFEQEINFWDNFEENLQDFNEKLGKNEYPGYYPIEFNNSCLDSFHKNNFFLGDGPTLILYPYSIETGMIHKIENFLFTKYPELNRINDNTTKENGISKTTDALVDNVEEDNINDQLDFLFESEDSEYESSTLNSLKDKYPSMFNKNGELKKEAVKLIIELIDKYAPYYTNTSKESIEANHHF